MKTYTYASLQEVDEFFNKEEVVELEHIYEGAGRGETEITVWTDGDRMLRRVIDFMHERYDWVSSRTPNK